MSPFFGFVLLFLAVTSSALMVATTFAVVTRSNALAVLLAAWTYFFAFVIGAFLATGYAELIFGIPSVSTAGAALASAVALAGILLTDRKAKPAQLVQTGFRAIWSALRIGMQSILRLERKVLVVATAALIAVLAVSSFVIGFPRGTEAMAYHLPNGIGVLQSGSLHLRDGVYYSALPANDGLWYALLGTFSERFVAMGQVPFLPVLALAVYGIARKAGADSRGAAFCAVGILTLPVITLQAGSAESDVAGLAFLAISVYFLMASENTKARYALAGLGIGLAFGFKSLYLIAGGVIALIAIVEPWLRRDQDRPWYVHTGIVWVSALAIGSFWAVRNLLETGNPLYPIHVKPVFDLLGWPAAWDIEYAKFLETQFHWVRTVWEWPVYPWVEWHYADSGTSYKGNAGLGAFFAAAIPLAWFHTFLTSVRASPAESIDEKRVRLMLFCAGTALVLAWFLIGNREPRYVSAAWAFLFPLAGYTVTAVRGSARRAFEILLTLCTIWMLVSFLAKETITFGDRIVYSKHFSRDRHYEYPPELDRLPADATILNLDDRAANYMLVGRGFKNRVIDYQWAIRTFGIDVPQKSTHVLSLDQDTKGVFLETGKLMKLKATHVYHQSHTAIRHDDCVRLDEVARLAKNPVSGARFDPPKVLYRIHYCKPVGARVPSGADITLM